MKKRTIAFMMMALMIAAMPVTVLADEGGEQNTEIANLEEAKAESEALARETQGQYAVINSDNEAVVGKIVATDGTGWEGSIRPVGAVSSGSEAVSVYGKRLPDSVGTATGTQGGFTVANGSGSGYEGSARLIAGGAWEVFPGGAGQLAQEFRVAYQDNIKPEELARAMGADASYQYTFRIQAGALNAAGVLQAVTVSARDINGVEYIGIVSIVAGADGTYDIVAEFAAGAPIESITLLIG